MKYIYRPNPTGGGRIGHTKGFTYHRRLLPTSPGKMRLALMLPQYEIPWRYITIVFVCVVALSALGFGGYKLKNWMVARRDAKEAATLAQAEQEKSSIKNDIKNQAKNGKQAIELGQANQKEGKLLEAEAAYEVALEYTPNWRDAYLSLGQIYLVQNKFEQAETALSHALALDPIYPTTHNLLSVLYEKTDRAESANTELKKADDLAKKMGLEIGG